jgi:hypothetical protein
MAHGTYLDPQGTHPHLKGKTAIIRPSESEAVVLAQFDDLSLGAGWTHNWTRFMRSSFLESQTDTAP